MRLFAVTTLCVLAAATSAASAAPTYSTFVPPSQRVHGTAGIRPLFGGGAIPSCKSATYCLGEENKGTGYAIEGLSLDGSGIFGETKSPSSKNAAAAGLYGLDASSDGGQLNFGVLGSSANGIGVSGVSSADTGMYGSGYSTGVFGISSASNANSIAVAGYNPGAGYGAYFQAPNGVGLAVTAGSNALGASSQNGIAVNTITSASNPNNLWSVASVVANGGSNGALGLYAYSAANMGAGIENSSPSAVTLYVKADQPSTPFYACGTTGCFVVENTGATYSFINGQDRRPRVHGYSAQASRQQMEDVGSGHIAAGRGFVRFDADLLKAMDVRTGYHIFLTADGDNRGLYVALKTPQGFEVREAQGGRSSLDFEYRIVGRPAGANDARLPIFVAKEANVRAARQPGVR